MAGLLPPNSRLTFFNLPVEAFTISLPLRRSGESNFVDEWMCGQGRACTFAIAGENVDYARGKACLIEQFGQPQRRHGRLLRDLMHHATTGGEGRGKLPHGHQKREVPGNDLANDADGLAQGVVVEGAGGGEVESGAGTFVAQPAM